MFLNKCQWPLEFLGLKISTEKQIYRFLFQIYEQCMESSEGGSERQGAAIQESRGGRRGQEGV